MSRTPLGFPIPVFFFHLSGPEELMDSMCGALVPRQHHHACCLFVQPVTKVQSFGFHAVQHLCQDWQHICDTTFNPRAAWEGKTETVLAMYFSKQMLNQWLWEGCSLLPESVQFQVPGECLKILFSLFRHFQPALPPLPVPFIPFPSLIIRTLHTTPAAVSLRSNSTE